MSVRVTRQYLEVLADGAGSARVSKQYIDTLAAGAGAVRVSKQYADVLLRGEGKLRVTRQYLDLIGNVPVERSLDDTVVLVDTYNTGYPRSLSDSLVFTDSYPREMEIEIADTVVFTEYYPRNHEGILTDTFTVVEQPIEYEISPGWVDILEFTEDFDWETDGVVAKTLKQRMAFVSTFVGRNSYYHLNQQHWIDFTEDHSGRNAVTRSALADTVIFVMVYKPGMTYSDGLSDTITCTDQFNNIYTLADTFTLTQVFLRGKGKSLIETVTYTDGVDRLLWSQKTYTDSTEFYQAYAYFEEGCNIEQNYNIFVGSSDSDNPAPPPLNLPLTQTLPVGTRFQLFYPATGVPTTTITLPAPEFGNKDQVVYNRVNRETRGGDLEIFVDPIWPLLNNLLCTFTGVSSSEIAAFKSFTTNYLGQEIRIMDWEGRTWIGVIKTPLDAVVTEHNNYYTISFEFVGQMMDIETPGNIFGVSDVMGCFIAAGRNISDDIPFVDYFTYIISS